MTKRYRLTQQAEQDVLRIWLHIAADSMTVADRLVDEFTETYDRLAEFPNVGTSMEQYRPRLRCFSLRSYLIFFTPIVDGIEVYRVLHGARQIEGLL
jgi:toxin ParE1/3/4